MTQLLLTSFCETAVVAEELLGGMANAGRVVRDGNAVLRPAPANVETLHALLDHLAANGFPSPRPLGRREDGVEILGFIPGETSVFPHPDEWVRSDETLQAIGRLLRSLHDVTRGFVPPEEAVWSADLADPKGGSVICHNDVCIENVVISEGSALSLLDFDFASPGRPTWDLAMTARYWVPLLDPMSAVRTGRQDLDPVARLRLLVDAYQADANTRRQFTRVLMEIEDVCIKFTMERVKRGDAAFVDMWEDSGGQEAYDRRMKWLKELQRPIDYALLA